jgi:hypothetical protein
VGAALYKGQSAGSEGGTTTGPKGPDEPIEGQFKEKK